MTVLTPAFESRRGKDVCGNAREVVKELATSASEAEHNKKVRMSVQEKEEETRGRKGKRKLPEEPLLPLPATVLESKELKDGLLRLIEAKRNSAEDGDVAATVTLAGCCIRLCMEEIIGLRLLCARTRVIMEHREGGRRRLQCTEGRMAAENFTGEELALMAQLSQTIRCVAPLLRAVITPAVRQAASAADAIQRRQLLALTASPIGDVRTDNFSPDLLAMLLNSLLTALLFGGDINDHLFVMMLLHAECLLQDALYDREELAAAKLALGEGSESASALGCSDSLALTRTIRVPLRQVSATRVFSPTT